MRLRVAVVFAALIGVAAAAATAQTAIRVDDLEVVDQMEQVQRALDRCLDALRPPEQSAVARGGQGEADLASALAALRTSGARMAAAYRPPWRTATAEVAKFLAQAKTVQAGLGSAPDPKAAQARWALAVDHFVQLGRAYHIDWHTDAAIWVPRRVSDQELRLAASSLRVAAHDLDEMLGATLDKDNVMDRTEKARASEQLATLSAAARDVLKRLEHYDDMTVSIPRALKAAATLKPLMETYVGASPARPQWQSVNQALGTIANGFGL